MKQNNYNNTDFKYYSKNYISRSAAIKDLQLFDLKYAEKIDDDTGFDKLIHTLPVFRHKFNKNIYFNKIYKSENSYHPGEHFVILKYYGVKKKEKNEDGSDKYINWVVLRFLESYTIVTIPYFNHDSIYRAYDPYHPTYSGYCSLGNISKIPSEYGILYTSWKEVMRRLFDPTYDLFSYFGGSGALLAYPPFACFEYFIEINNELAANGLMQLTDPNDPTFYRMYLFDNNSVFSPYNTFHTNNDIATLSRFPYADRISEDYILSLKLKNISFGKRTIDLTPKKTGRPKGVKNKIHKLYRLAKDKPVNQLYRIIDKY